MKPVTVFLEELKSSLPKSSYEQRKKLAIFSIENNIDLKELSELIKCEKKIATKFMWLLSDFAILSPNKLFAELPYLLSLCNTFKQEYKIYFASYWLYVGVPSENEGEAIDLLFQLLLSNDTNVTIKARSCLVLLKLTKKYPELKNELKYSINDQLNKYTKDFDKRMSKILIQLDK